MRYLVSTSLLLGLVSPLAAADAKVTYDEHVVPILREKCFSCHNPDRKSGGLRLNTYTNLLAGGASGESVRPGDPDGSLLVKLVSHQQEPFMPPKSPPLPKESLEIIRRWVQGGALENSGSKAIAARPKVEIGLKSIVKGKPEGPPPMPPKLPLDPVLPTARANAVTALAANPWSPLLAVGGQKQVILYNVDTLDFLGVLPFPEGTPHVLKFSRNGSLLLAGGGHDGKSGRVAVWSVTTGERIITVGEEYDAVLAADISADQTQIALGGPSKVVRVYSTKDGKLLHEIKKHTDWIYTIEYSPDGVLLATGDRNGGLFVWEAYTGREYFSLRGHTAAITGLSWRADSNVLASSSEDGTLRLWEMENGGNIKSWSHGAPALSVGYGRDGRLVSCGRDRVVKLWDGNGAGQRAFEALPDVALRTVFSHDGNRVVGSDWSGQVRVWNTADGKALGSLLANPPTLADRLILAANEVTARQKAHEQAAAALTAAQAAAQKAAADLAAAQKAVADSTAAAKTATEALAKAKDAVGKAAAALAAAQARVAARDVLTKAFAEAAAKVNDAAGKAKDNAELAAAAAKAREVAAQAAGELAAAQKSVAELTPVAKIAQDQVNAAQQAANQSAAALAAANQQMPARTQQATNATNQANAAKAAVDQAAAAVDTARAQLEKWKAAHAQAKATPSK